MPDFADTEAIPAPDIAMINSASAIALSGLQAAQTRLDASAHNIANLQTDNFHRQEVSQQSEDGGGTRVQVRRSPVPGEALPRDLVEQFSAGYSFVANLKVIETERKMTGALLNEKA